MKILRLLLACLTVVLLAACAQPTSPAQPQPNEPDPDPGNGPAPVVVQAQPAFLTFAGTSTATVELTATGPWTAESDQSWLTITPASGTGSSVVTITADRAGLRPDHYAGSVLFRGGSQREVVTIAMRFPSVSGNLSDPSGQIATAAAPERAADPAELPHVPGEVLVQLDSHMIALDLLTEPGPDSHNRLPSGLELQQTAASLRPQDLRAAAVQLAADYRLDDVEQLAPGGSVFIVRGEPDVSTMIERLSRDGRVAVVQPNHLASLQAAPNDPEYHRQWHYNAIKLPQAWDVTTGSPEIVTAVIDSAVDTSHPDLVGRLVPGYDFNTSTVHIATPADDHGTHVAGTIAAAGNNGIGVTGINWNSRVMPLNVFGPDDSAALTDVYRAIVFAAGMCVSNSAGVPVCNDSPVDVINISLGVDNRRCLAMPTDSILREAVAFALGQGVTIVAGAGNNGCGVVTIPAAIPGVLAVSATNIHNLKASYSNSGQQIWVSAPGGGEVGQVLSTTSGGWYGYMAGTSMASPHVAGTAALIKAANPELTPTQVAFILRETATDLGLEGPDTWYGYGLINAEEAVTVARNTLTAAYPDFIVRVMSGGAVMGETRTGPTGSFSFSNLAAGTYTVVAGNDRNGNGALGDAGEFYGTTTLEVSYDGDTGGITVPVAPQ